MQASPLLSLSPSSPTFNTCSSGRLAEIAARVIEEFRQESGSQDDIYEAWPQQKQHQQLQQEVMEGEDNEDDDFEFAFVCREPETSPKSADEIFYNGQIRPIYPLFNTNLLNDDQTPDVKNVDCNSFASKPRSHRLPLRELMSEERETTSCSSSEAGELDGVTPGTYCVWTPKGGKSENIEKEYPGRCKKSNSTGLPKRWRLRDLVYRSNSDGKDTFVFLAPSKRDKTSNADVNKVMEFPGKFKEAEEHCGRNRDMKPWDKRRSFLPYRQDLEGIFSNVNGLSRNLHPF
ncbi:uncharacterized protein LOC111288940 [Durio zibethinus]|uniref:Uncharacterized protein LOC111288940 n=1 Tax=Durio zibethinus TaxID=66656 RepID=A0A6P5Y586_DURZI|nr:uncharacterized protein LOC111288940 [Durio zibethinus]